MQMLEALEDMCGQQRKVIQAQQQAIVALKEEGAAARRTRSWLGVCAGAPGQATARLLLSWCFWWVGGGSCFCSSNARRVCVVGGLAAFQDPMNLEGVSLEDAGGDLVLRVPFLGVDTKGANWREHHLLGTLFDAPTFVV